MTALVFMLIWLVPVLVIPFLNYHLGKSDACHEEFLRITKEEGDCCYDELERVETGLTENEWRHKCAIAERRHIQDMTYPTCFIPVFGLVISVVLLVFIGQAEIRYLIKKIRRK